MAVAKDEFARRFAAAKATRRAKIDDDGREVYKFCFNGREKEWDDTAGKNTDDDPDEIFTDAPSTIAEEFAGELFSTMTPENAPWAEFEAGNAQDEDNVDSAVEQIGDFEKLINKALRASNYYSEGPTAFQDCIVGNAALWADRPTLNSPIVFEAVPLAELYLRLGPFGIDDRFRVRRFAYSDLEALLPDANFPRKIQDKIKNSSSAMAKVTYGFWLTYKDPENPIWRQEIRVDGDQVGLDKDLAEDGSCPLLVGRFNPEANSPWGRGPGRRMLPTMRTLDALTMMGLEGMDRTLDPAIIYPHDGMLDLSNGIESGMAYPAMPGFSDNIQKLGLEGSLDYGFFAEDRLQEQLRDGFYRETMQKGKTPPSASQFVGQEQKQLRRIARPAAKLWKELGVGLLKRVEYLERQPGGGLVDQKFPLIDSGTVMIRPISPLERAQAREEVLVGQSLMAMANEAVGPQQAALLIDGPKTMRNVKTKLKDQLVEFRSEEDMMKIMQAMQPQQPQQQAAAPGGENVQQ